MTPRTALKIAVASFTALMLASSLGAQSIKPANSSAKDIEESSLKAAVVKAEQANPSGVPSALTDLARYYKDAGRTAEAEAAYTKVVDLIRSSNSPNDRRVLAISITNLAVFYHDQGMFSKAEPLYRRVVELKRQGPKPDAREIASALNNLSRLYEDSRNDTELAATLQEIVTLWQKDHVVADSRAAQAFSELAEIRQRASDAAGANAFYAQAFRIWSNAPALDTATASRVLGLARAFRAAGNNANAEQFYTLVLGHSQESEAAGRAVVAATELGEMYRLQGNYAQAQQSYLTALELKESRVSPDSIELAAPISNVALILNVQGKYSEAEPYYRRALEIREQNLGPNHPDVLSSMLYYASCLRNSGNQLEAMRVESMAETASSKSLKAKTVDTSLLF